jgi:translation initiation factor 1
VSDDAIVYSSGEGRICPECRRPAKECICKQAEPAPAGDGVLRVRRELKGRRGKTVTRVSGFQLAAGDLKEMARRIKRHCGTGGGMDGADLIIQGDQVEKVMALLAGEGFVVKRSGG